MARPSRTAGMRARIPLADMTLGNKLVIEIAGRSGSGFQLAHRAALLCPVSAADAQADLPAPPGSHAERQNSALDQGNWTNPAVRPMEALTV